MTTAALNNLWAYIEGMGLTASEKQWLANKLEESDLQIDDDKNSAKKEGLTGLQWLLEHPIGDIRNNDAENECAEPFKRLRRMGHIAPDDVANDDRLAYILSK